MRRILDELTKARIVDEITHYCRQVLERPNSVFGNKPACPFSRREREADKIQYEFFAIDSDGPSADVVHVVREFAAVGRHTTLLLTDPDKQVTVDEGVAYGLELSRQCRAQQMIAISLHPDDDYAIHGFQPRRGVPYVTMLCQSAAYLREAKQQLAGSGYYARWSQAALDYNFEQIGQFLSS
ncbi:MAG TPA: hypothetical protein VHZ24_13900 [Pirellulales bacterium]|jgi:hypothetical protein|nr:hypothetical protein [Pirellulales bacterium]